MHAESIAPKAEAVGNAVQTVSIDALIHQDALKYSIDEEHLYKTLKCESADFKDVSIRGDNGLARGLAQIRSDYHSEISDEQADDPVFAIDFIAKMFSEDRATEWSCYRILRAKNWQE